MADSQGMHSAGAALHVASYLEGPPVARPIGTPWVPGQQLGLGAYKALPELIDCNGIDIRASITRVTHLRSDGKVHEKVPGFKDGNQLSCRFNYFKAFFVEMARLVPGGSGAPDAPLGANNQIAFWGKKKWVLEMPDGGCWYFTGFLAGFPIQLPEDDRVSLDVTIEVAGAPTFYALA